MLVIPFEKQRLSAILLKVSRAGEMLNSLPE
jgi:hypothetical protein